MYFKLLDCLNIWIGMTFNIFSWSVLKIKKKKEKTPAN